MYEIDMKNNKIDELQKVTFKDLGIKEREHLQEWIAMEPQSLGEDLLIIQKEFAGFSDTNERLDLLALDKQGNVVVIENKLDDTGKDVVWQALKYVSYCSTLTKENIIEIYGKYLEKNNTSSNAVELIEEFFDDVPIEEISLNESQRIILVAANFRKEVTSTAMWLLNQGILVQCIKTTPHKIKDTILLDIEQIIPVVEAKEYIIELADKTKKNTTSKEANRILENLRYQFWKGLLPLLSNDIHEFSNVNPSTGHWIAIGTGVSGVQFTLVVTKKYCGVELFIRKSKKEENKTFFDDLSHYKIEIERKLNKKLEWQRLDDRITSRVALRNYDFDISKIERWEEYEDFFLEETQRFINTFREYLPSIY